MAQLLDRLDILTEQLKLSIDNQNEIKGAITELREVVHRENAANRQFLERLVEVESISKELSSRLSKIESLQLEMRNIDKRGKWKVYFIITTSILGWIGILIQKYFN
jgi:hypothetical protein